MALTAERPVFEVVLRLSGNEVAVLAAFQGAADVVDILVGVDDTELKSEYADILEQGAFALRSAGNWINAASSHLPEPPF